MLFVFIYAYWCPTRFPFRWSWCHLAVKRRVTRVEQVLLTLPEHLGFVLFICL